MEGETPVEPNSMPESLPQRKRPAHFPPVEHHNTPIVVFVTMVICPRVNFLANTLFDNAFKEAILVANAWRVGLYVIMPDHVHLFAVPGEWPAMRLGNWILFLKRMLSRLLGAHPAWDWQAGYWDTQMRNRDGYEEQLAYMRLNPVRKGFVNTIEEWPWKGEGAPILW